MSSKVLRTKSRVGIGGVGTLSILLGGVASLLGGVASLLGGVASLYGGVGSLFFFYFFFGASGTSSCLYGYFVYSIKKSLAAS